MHNAFDIESFVYLGQFYAARCSFRRHQPLALLFPGGSADPDSGHGLLRKLAHFTEFACLGALFSWLFGMLRKKAIFALPCGFAAASIDETIQRFVPGRGPSFYDVLIDTSGVLMGILFLILGHAIYKKSLKEEKI